MYALIDVDDVLLDWTGGFDTWARIHKNYTGPLISLRSDHIGELFYEGIYAEFNSSDDFKSLKPIKDARESLKIISKKYDIILITSCGPEFLQSRKINLDKHFFGINFKIEILNLHENKDQYIDYYNPNIYVDDNIHNVKYCSEQGCINTYIFHTEFNRLFEHFKVKRAYTWQQIIKEI